MATHLLTSVGELAQHTHNIAIAAVNDKYLHQVQTASGTATTGTISLTDNAWSSYIGTGGSGDFGGGNGNTRFYRKQDARSISGTINNSGEGEIHNNIQPYITCYIWLRIS